MYTDANGEPADEESARILEEGMTAYLSFLLCRLPGVTKSADTSRPAKMTEREWWARQLRREGLGLSLDDVDLSELRTRVQRLLALAPSDWHRAVVRRLSVLVFQLAPSDPLIRRMADHFLRTEDWYDWDLDPELESFVEQRQKDEHVDRQLRILSLFTRHRAQIAYSSASLKRPVDLTMTTSRGKFCFRYPSPHSRHGEVVEKENETRSFLRKIAPSMLPGFWFETRFLAAAVWVGRRFLVSPRRLVSCRPLTQEKVASYFGLTRRQLTHGLSIIQKEDFHLRFWNEQERRRAARAK